MSGPGRAAGPSSRLSSGSPTAPSSVPAAGSILDAVWGSAVPAALLDADFRFIDVNEAFVSQLLLARDPLIGTDPVLLEPAEDQEISLLQRHAQHDRPAQRRRLVDGQGGERWFLITQVPVVQADQPLRWLTLLQDETAEHVAREQARRAEAELAQWFELSGTGMLVYDNAGLIVRSNAAFETLVERVPEILDEAPAELQSLLGWEQGAMLPLLQPGARLQERQALLPLADGRRRRLSARLVCHGGAGGQRRVMAVVQDRSAEDERDLAQLEMGMMMGTASIGVATYDPAHGWLASSAPGSGSAAAKGDSQVAGQGGSLLGIGRELVEPASLPEFERLQQALRRGERTEVR